ncbi:hypothetical protein D3C75_308950 [compost metagenome]
MSNKQKHTVKKKIRNSIDEFVSAKHTVDILCGNKKQMYEISEYSDTWILSVPDKYGKRKRILQIQLKPQNQMEIELYASSFNLTDLMARECLYDYQMRLDNWSDNAEHCVKVIMNTSDNLSVFLIQL